ncbi:hypothetical protein [Paludisphaera borealis]|uniref:Uncharacterized protein n=1 Tax=Paludisphaera borealis TaxID=1387353 RepID=A0A1U7CMY9_9BACT|nr:hypothetical protein [Paludisphaera borealis]APW60253.1 hypothetical protein BSF38_01720 [Paludisphaera borealis]
MNETQKDVGGRRTLVVVPGRLNYFYNQAGRRIAEVLRAMGSSVEIRTLAETDESSFDLAFLCNVSEIVASIGDEAEGLKRLRALRGRCRELLSLSIDCVSTPWYARLCELSRQIQADRIIDLGIIAQTPPERPKGDPRYEFLFSGLTPSESRTMDRWTDDGPERSIPWAFVGHVTESRAALVDRLIHDLHPGGFVYVPALAPYTEQGSPHLNEQQFDQVLKHTRYQIWCSHHDHFYMEPERFRSSLLTGGVPIKIVPRKQVPPAGSPFSYLLFSVDALYELSDQSFTELADRFRDDWRNLPTLEQGLRTLLGDPSLADASRHVRAA